MPQFRPAIAISLFLLLPLAAPAQDTPTTATLTQAQQARGEALSLLDGSSLGLETRLSAAEALAARHPGVAEAWAVLGELREQAEMDEAALEAFGKAVALNPGLSSSWHRIGVLNKRERRNLAAAEDAFRRALEANPENRAATLNELAVTLAMMGRMEQAAGTWKEAIALDPGWGVLYANAMKASLALGRREEARSLFQRGLEAERFEPTAVLHWTENLLEQGEKKEAFAAYEMALRRHPKDARIRYFYAQALADDGQEDEAARELQRVLESVLATEDRALRETARVDLFALQNARDWKRFNEAVDLVLRRPNMEPGRHEKDLRKAVKLTADVLKDHPDFWNARFVRGTALRRLGELEEARGELGAVLKQEGEEPNSLLQMALLEREAGAMEKAMDYAERAVAEARNDPTVLMNAGLVYVDGGNCEAARAAYDRARKLVPLAILGESADPLVPLADEIARRCGNGQPAELPP